MTRALTARYRRPGLLLALGALCGAATAPARPPVPPQRIESTSGAVHPTVGDPVTVRLRVQLPPDAVPLDSSPRLHAPLAEGVRVLDAGAWRASGGALSARVMLAFFRPGSTSTPAFDLAYRRASSAAADTARGAALAIVIVPTLPENAAAMRDIKDLIALPGSGRARWIAVAIGMFVLAAIVLLVRRVRRRRAAAETAPGITTQADPFDEALRELSAIERAGWATSDVARHFERVSDTVRGYLERAHGVRALNRTTPEIVWLLADALAAGGQRQQLARLLEDADLVKFARWRPRAPEAAAFLERARALLGTWHERTRARVPETADAIR